MTKLIWYDISAEEYICESCDSYQACKVTRQSNMGCRTTRATFPSARDKAARVGCRACALKAVQCRRISPHFFPLDDVPLKVFRRRVHNPCEEPEDNRNQLFSFRNQQSSYPFQLGHRKFLHPTPTVYWRLASLITLSFPAVLHSVLIIASFCIDYSHIPLAADKISVRQIGR